MKKVLKMDFAVNKATKSVDVEREFAAPIAKVWDAWTKPEILDQWWAPKPWKAESKSLDFKEGGKWIYAMVGPDGEKHWAIAEYLSIDPKTNFKALDAFCDEKGILNQDFPQSKWDVTFSRANDDHTMVRIVCAYDNLEDLETILKMGFKEGFLSAMENLDEIFERKGRN